VKPVLKPPHPTCLYCPAPLKSSVLIKVVDEALLQPNAKKIEVHTSVILRLNQQCLWNGGSTKQNGNSYSLGGATTFFFIFLFGVNPFPF
jgi:hypothetical protein